MVRKPGSKHSASSSRVIARRNDWNSIRDLHQGPRSLAASRGRIHDRSPILSPEAKKALAERGPSIHDVSSNKKARAGPALFAKLIVTALLADGGGAVRLLLADAGQLSPQVHEQRNVLAGNM